MRVAYLTFVVWLMVIPSPVISSNHGDAHLARTSPKKQTTSFTPRHKSRLFAVHNGKNVTSSNAIKRSLSSQHFLTKPLARIKATSASTEYKQKYATIKRRSEVFTLHRKRNFKSNAPKKFSSKNVPGILKTTFASKKTSFESKGYYWRYALTMFRKSKLIFVTNASLMTNGRKTITSLSYFNKGSEKLLRRNVEKTFPSRKKSVKHGADIARAMWSIGSSGKRVVNAVKINTRGKTRTAAKLTGKHSKPTYVKVVLTSKKYHFRTAFATRPSYKKSLYRKSVKTKAPAGRGLTLLNRAYEIKMKLQHKNFAKFKSQNVPGLKTSNYFENLHRKIHMEKNAKVKSGNRGDITRGRVFELRAKLNNKKVRSLDGISTRGKNNRQTKEIANKNIIKMLITKSRTKKLTRTTKFLRAKTMRFVTRSRKPATAPKKRPVLKKLPITKHRRFSTLAGRKKVPKTSQSPRKEWHPSKESSPSIDSNAIRERRTRRIRRTAKAGRFAMLHSVIDSASGEENSHPKLLSASAFDSTNENVNLPATPSNPEIVSSPIHSRWPKTATGATTTCTPLEATYGLDYDSNVRASKTFGSATNIHRFRRTRRKLKRIKFDRVFVARTEPSKTETLQHFFDEIEVDLSNTLVNQIISFEEQNSVSDPTNALRRDVVDVPSQTKGIRRHRPPLVDFNHGNANPWQPHVITYSSNRLLFLGTLAFLSALFVIVAALICCIAFS